MMNNLLALTLLLVPVAQTGSEQRDSRSIESLLTASGAQELPAWGHLNHGALAVGYEKRGGLSIWYPARPGKAMQLGDYAAARDFNSLGLDVSALLAMPMYGSNRAEALPGSYPLVVAPGGYLNAGMFAETAEFLASHGMIVVFFPVTSEAVRDALQYSTRMLASFSHPSADLQRIALWGYQRGGLTATLMQGASNARAIVSIEGAEGWVHKDYGYPAGRRLLAKLPKQAPVIRFQSDRERPRWYFSSPVNTTLDYYRDYPAALSLADISGVSHDQLSVFAVWARLLPGLMKPSAGALRAHQRIGEEALQFLQAHL